MKNCDNLFLTGQTEYENIHKMCSDAYTKGRMAERALLSKHTDYVVTTCLATDA